MGIVSARERGQSKVREKGRGQISWENIENMENTENMEKMENFKQIT